MISLLVPWHAGDPWRGRVWAWLEAAWRREMPDAEICVGDDEGIPFSRAAAVNAAAAKATGDVFVILDADTWFEPDGIRRAVRRLELGEAWVPKAYKYFLDEPRTRALLACPEPAFRLEGMDSDSYVIPAPMVLRREAFEAVNGFDERFRGWGCEDNAFVLALQRMVHMPKAGEGTAVHLWHPTTHIDGVATWPGQRRARPGMPHLRRYYAARNPKMMGRLVMGNRMRPPDERRVAAFRRVWQANTWQGASTRSGPGSDPEAVRDIAPVVQRLLRRTRTVLDVGCGEGGWMPDLPGYTGVDIVPEAIEVARSRHPNREYLVLDSASQPLPPADAVICRDVLPHLSLEDGAAVLENIRATGAHLLLATTYTDGRNTGAMADGHYRPDLTAPPFGLGEPVQLIPDGRHPGYNVPEKMLGVWVL